MDPTPLPYVPVSPDPGIFGAFAAFAGVGVVLYIGVTFLVIWGTYWLIRLAVRHGGMDVRRWERAGMPPRMPKKYKPSRGGGYSGGSLYKR